MHILLLVLKIIIISYPSPKSHNLSKLVTPIKFSQLIKHISLEYSCQWFHCLIFLSSSIFFSMPKISTMRKKKEKWLQVKGDWARRKGGRWERETWSGWRWRGEVRWEEALTWRTNIVKLHDLKIDVKIWWLWGTNIKVCMIWKTCI